ncbi:MAG: bifunctional ADP-dependent NAD(P)H-hydrate dehydratase/NAD(P)H-hydrate epimerase, partial [Burkholderiales bacterium]|nr:bifunctional ADP-dependent NAD(P)H-hydrate dehydratase/NAD(P)H-hydrate epimerase [Anaerolineae bacterium]
LDNDTGEIDKNTIPAAETVTFIAAKPGLFAPDAVESVGDLVVATIGIPPETEGLKDAKHTLVDSDTIRALLPERPAGSNKGTFGKALIAAGSVNYTGAAALSAESAYRIGAGLVAVGAPAPVIAALAARLAEPTWLLLPHDMGVVSSQAAAVIQEQAKNYNALLLGPGWGQENTTRELLEKLFQRPDDSAKGRAGLSRSLGFGAHRTSETDEKRDKSELKLPPLVIDADGLNLLAKIDEWWKMLPENTIITPHPGEMGRLAGVEIADVQKDRWGIAAQKAAEWNVILVLKGAHTLVAAPDGRVSALPFKTAALATAGTGDVLAGAIVGLLAQGLAPYDAAIVAGYLHGLAGEIAAEQHGNTHSVIAGDVLRALPDAFRRLSVG